MSSRERLLAALNCEKVDHIPLAFMLFTALNKRLGGERRAKDPAAAIEAQVAMGLDTVVNLDFFSPYNETIGHADAPGIPVRFAEGVTTRERLVPASGSAYPVLHKQYMTPAGELSVVVNQTEDWPYGNLQDGKLFVPFMDDYLAPRCTKYLIETLADLDALRHLLVPPTESDLNICRAAWDEGRILAGKHDLLLAAGWGVGGDALAWFCGLQNAVMMAIERPEFLAELLAIIAAWNKPRMQAFLDYGVDLFIRRAWYEGTDFWSPALFRQFYFPIIREEIRMAHEAGVKYGYILTSGSMLLHDMLLELEIDVLLGPDPVQGKGTDLQRMGEQLGGRICTWGGVNGFITIEQGTNEEIDDAVSEAIDRLGPDGFILSPVDNVRDASDDVWQRVLVLIESWKKHRQRYGGNR
jgi:uroporphyrinogen-III decarboxylase